ncbi:MAG: PH domain-containing protein [bacterium]|nr:PH domain-containing protein [bacterium]
MKFKATKDMVVKIVSTCVILLFIFLAYLSICDILNANQTSIILINIAVVVFLLATLLVCFIYSPLYYQFESDAIIVKRSVKDLRIYFTEISEVLALQRSDLTGTIRTFGVGGLFGYFGKFRNKKYGKMNWYASQSKNYLLLILKNGEKIIITPDDLNLLNLLKDKINQ